MPPTASEGPSLSFDTSRFQAELAEASLTGPQHFVDELVKEACRTFFVKAASFYVYLPTPEILRLRSAQGLPLGEYASPELPVTALAGRAITDAGGVHYEPTVVGHPDYRDQRLAVSLGLAHFVAIAIGVDDPDPRVPDPLGVLNVYCDSEDHARSVEPELKRAGPYLARLYIAALERGLMELRRDTVEQVVSQRTVRGACDAAVVTFQRALPCDSCSLFLYDETSRILRLVSSTDQNLIHGAGRLTWPNAGTETQDLPLYAFRSEQVFGKTTNNPSWHIEPPYDHPGAYFSSMGFRREAEDDLQNSDIEALIDFSSGLMVPVSEASAPGGRTTRPIGLLFAANRRNPSFPGFVSNFSWEDTFAGIFFAEMMAVVTALLLRSGDYEYEFERRMHKAKSNLNSAITYLNTLEDLGRFSLWSARDYYYIDDCRLLVSDVVAQIERGELARARIETKRTDLYRDVIASLPKHISRVSEEAGLRSNLNRLADSGLEDLPEVWGNTDALVCVFTNLVDNAIKYAGGLEQNRVEMTITASTRAGVVVVDVEDDGIGIPLEERDRVFDDGFRGVLAAALTPDGLGKGLSDCRIIVTKLGGSLVLAESESGKTCFRVELLAASAHKRPPVV